MFERFHERVARNSLKVEPEELFERARDFANALNIAFVFFFIHGSDSLVVFDCIERAGRLHGFRSLCNEPRSLGSLRVSFNTSLTVSTTRVTHVVANA